MKAPFRRSTGVSTAVATATEPIDEARVAFESLYRESRDDLFAYVAGLLRDRSAAEEVTAQAFERAWRRKRQLDPERGSPRAWLFGIARNAALDELRRRSRMGSMLSQGHSSPSPAAVPSASAAQASGGDPAQIAVERTALRQALDSLDGRDRELVALKYFAGLSNAEIASVTGTSESNAGTRLHRTLEKLRRSFDDAV
jgi:RNA polymerase sigma-70 factor, ECF subfamily